MLQGTSLYLTACGTVTANRGVNLRQMSKNTRKPRCALNMGNFYLASELPRGENCHILAVGVFCRFGGIPVEQSGSVGGLCGGSPKSAKSC